MLLKVPINVRKLQRAKNATKQQFLHEKWNLYCLKNLAKFFDAFQRDDQENFLQGFPYRIKHQN